MNGNLVVLAVALLVWGLLFVYLMRIERRVREPSPTRDARPAWCR